MSLDYSEILIGIAEIAVALAGFTGVAVAIRSRNDGGWQPGDAIRLSFLLESSLTAAGFSLLTLVLIHLLPGSNSTACAIASLLWALFMPWSLYSSSLRIRESLHKHVDADRMSNRLVAAAFLVLIVVQVGNGLVWQQFAPLLAALSLNLAASAMQFTRLIQSAIQE